MDRDEFEIAFLECRDGQGFITGDQPVVNLMGTGDGRETMELALYYPLSPVLACLVTPREYSVSSMQVPVSTVAALNTVIEWESMDFLIASSNKALEVILNGSSSARLTGQLIIDLLAEGQ